MNFNKNFKFVELHNHLDGSIKAETIEKICERKKIAVPIGNARALKSFLEIKEPSSLRIILDKFDTVLPIIRGDQEAIAQVCHDFIKTAAESEICYIESRFCPEILETKSLSTESVLVTVLDALERAGQQYGVVSRTILSSLRQHEKFQPINLQLAIKYKSHGVVGIDLAGDEQYSMEQNGTHKEIVKMFQQAKKEGIHRTVHAGENGSVKLIREAIDEMFAERIGHGYQLLEHEEYYHELKDKNVHLEVCPSSSFLTGAVPNDPKSHPIHRFLNDKFNYSVNCDDIMITGKNLKEEYDFCRKTFNFSDDELIRTNFNAAYSSFLEDDDKFILVNHLSQAFKGNRI